MNGMDACCQKRVRNLDWQHLRDLRDGAAHVAVHDVRHYLRGFLGGRQVLIGLRVGSVLAPEPFRLHKIWRTTLVQEVVEEVTEPMRADVYLATMTVNDRMTLQTERITPRPLRKSRTFWSVMGRAAWVKVDLVPRCI